MPPTTPKPGFRSTGLQEVGLGFLIGRVGECSGCSLPDEVLGREDKHTLQEGFMVSMYLKNLNLKP